MLLRSLGLVVLVLGKVCAEVPDPRKDLVQIANAQSVVVGNYFYTVGGYATFNVRDGFPLGTKNPAWDGTRIITSNDHLRRIDLTRPFSVNKLDTVQEQTIPLSDAVPRMRFGSIWAHNTIIYLGSSDLEIYSLLRNGVWSNEPRKVPTKDVWTYDTANREAVWASVSGVEYNGTFNPVTKGSVAFLDGKAYVMGGTYGLSTTLKNPDGTPATPDLAEVEDVKLSSLLKLDVERKVFINETSSIGHVDSGRMVAIKGVGQKGVLIYIGGESSSGYNDMSTIRIYDIATSTWKSQKATAKDGDFPRGRIDFCAVVMSAQDNSSHQIYFYGGYSDGPGTRLPLDDAWVLTLPYFQYLKVGNSIEATRISGTCAVISPQYLLAYRGRTFVAGEQGVEGFNSLGDASLALLDLTDLKWKTEYTPARASMVYRVPQKVIETIGGDETGNATTTTPKNGFDDESLDKIFNPLGARNSTSLSPSPSPSPSTLDSESPIPPKKGIIIGITIPCATIALLSIAGIVLFFRRRQNNRLRASPEEHERGPWGTQEADGNMVFPVMYELEGGDRPAVHEIGSGWMGVGGELEGGHVQGS